MLPKDFDASLVEISALVQDSPSLLNEVATLLKLILVLPATNATSERSFSALKRVKTVLRSSMSQTRVNNLMVLHVYKDKTDALHGAKVGRDFVGVSEHRYVIFGDFV